ncbi:MAG: hypothetical protein LQ342_005962 [Letrouitia transgressa]|nr:MAG: hypothetical protein LQ342_005962 [Letrouitia transgressa]
MNHSPLQARRLPPIPISNPQDVFQRALTPPSSSAGPSPTAQNHPEQRNPQPIGVRNLLNPVDENNQPYVELVDHTTGLLSSIEPATPDLRTNPRHNVKRENESGNRVPSQTLLYRQISRAERPVAHPLTPTNQARRYSANALSRSSSGPTMLRIVGPLPSSPTPKPCDIMTLETDKGPIQVSVDVQAASKAADEKRRRNTSASHRFRQRRREKEAEVAEKIANLEAQVRDGAEERDRYLRERDHYRGIALHLGLYATPRPPSPRHRRYVTLGGESLEHFHETDGGRQNDLNARRRRSDYDSPRGLSPPALMLPPPVPPVGPTRPHGGLETPVPGLASSSA